MKSYVLHGENQPLSRKKLQELIKEAKEKQFEIVRVDAKKEKPNLRLLSRSQGLLNQSVLVVIENLFGNHIDALSQVEILKKSKDTNFVFWESKTLTPATVKKLPANFAIQEFPIPQTVFSFLDSLSPGNMEYSLKLLLQARERGADEFLLTMLARQIRLLIWAKEGPESLSVAPWQAKKLETQAKKFTAEQLRAIHAQLLDLDRKSKKSQLPEGLGESLELLIASL